jgi:hypothetical protein
MEQSQNVYIDESSSLLYFETLQHSTTRFHYTAGVPIGVGPGEAGWDREIFWNSSEAKIRSRSLASAGGKVGFLAERRVGPGIFLDATGADGMVRACLDFEFTELSQILVFHVAVPGMIP